MYRLYCIGLIFQIWTTFFTYSTSVVAEQEFCTFVENAKMKNYTECPNPICKQTFKLAFINKQPLLPNDTKMQDLITNCCGKWSNISTPKIIEDISYLDDPASPNAPDFVFPVLSDERETRKYGYYSIPYLDVDTAWYITIDPKTTALSSIFQLYPILIIVILMAMVSGFIAWFIESKENNKEFPNDFLSGWFEGFYFSFITMTTVGYGDKAPKSFAGKLYSTLWTLVGIVACGLITGTITNEISKANTPPPPSMKGRIVGIVKHHTYEGYIASKNGGIIKEIDGADLAEIVISLTRGLQTGKLDGILLDKYTLWVAQIVLTHRYNYWSDEKDKDMMHFFTHNTVRVEQKHIGPNMVYSILVKNLRDYNYFHRAVRDNRFFIEKVFQQKWTSHVEGRNFTSTQHSFYSTTAILFSTNHSYFILSVSILGAIIVVSCLSGIFYQRFVQNTKKACNCP